MSEQGLTRCENCGSEGAKVRRTSRSYGEGGDLLVIEGVPFVACATCGERYMTADTLHRLERLKERRHELAEDREIEVVQFADASPIS